MSSNISELCGASILCGSSGSRSSRTGCAVVVLLGVAGTCVFGGAAKDGGGCTPGLTRMLRQRPWVSSALMVNAGKRCDVVRISRNGDGVRMR